MDTMKFAKKSALFLSLLPVFLHAGNLKELIELSLKNESYLIKAWQNKQDENQKNAAFASYLPSLSLSMAYAANNKDCLITEPKESLFARVSLKFLLFDGGKREAHLKSLKLKQNLSTLDKKQHKNYLALSAIVLYFNYLSLEEIIKTHRQKRLFLEKTLQRLEKFYVAGLSARDELESVRAKYHLADLELLQKELQLEELKKELFILNQNDLIPQRGNLIKELENDHTQSIEILKATEEIKRAKEGVNIARAEFFPHFFLQDHYGFYKNHHHPKLPPNYQIFAESFLNKYAQNHQILLGFEWKIFDFNARTKELENKRLEVQISRAHLSFLERKNKKELEYLRKNLQVLKERITSLSYALNAAQIAFKSVDEKYRAGLCSYVEYLGALEAQFQAMGDVEFAKNEREIAKANYYFLAGFDLGDRILQ